MASASEILLQEASNQDRIYLHLEGMFWKAYQHSAYQFLQRYGKYKVSKKYVKAVKQEIVLLGFPEKSLSRLFPQEGQIRRMSEKLVYVDCDSLNEAEYAGWFRSVPLDIPACRNENGRAYRLSDDRMVKPVNDAAMKPADDMVRKEMAEKQRNTEDVIRKLREFRLEASTPMECMSFIHELKNEIKGL